MVRVNGQRRARRPGGGVELGRADAEDVRAAAHLVQRGQPRPAVERGVLHPLGQHRAGGLAEPHDQLVPRGLLGRVSGHLAQAEHGGPYRVQGRVQALVQAVPGRRGGRGHRRRGGRGRRLAGGYVGPVHAELGQHGDQHVMQVGGGEAVQGRVAGPGEQPGQPGQLGGEGAVGDVVLGVPLHLGETLLRRR